MNNSKSSNTSEYSFRANLEASKNQQFYYSNIIKSYEDAEAPHSFLMIGNDAYDVFYDKNGDIEVMFATSYGPIPGIESNLVSNMGISIECIPKDISVLPNLLKEHLLKNANK